MQLIRYWYLFIVTVTGLISHWNLNSKVHPRACNTRSSIYCVTFKEIGTGTNVWHSVTGSAVNKLDMQLIWYWYLFLVTVTGLISHWNIIQKLILEHPAKSHWLTTLHLKRLGGVPKYCTVWQGELLTNWTRNL